MPSLLRRLEDRESDRDPPSLRPHSSLCIPCRQSPCPASSSTGRKGNSSGQGSEHWRFGSQLKKTVLRSPSVRTSAPRLSCRHSQPFYTGTHCHLQSSCSRTMQSNCQTSNNDSRKKKKTKISCKLDTPVLRWWHHLSDRGPINPVTFPQKDAITIFQYKMLDKNH